MKLLSTIILFCNILTLFAAKNETGQTISPEEYEDAAKVYQQIPFPVINAIKQKMQDNIPLTTDEQDKWNKTVAADAITSAYKQQFSKKI